MDELVRNGPSETKTVLAPELSPNPLSDGIAKTWPLLRTLNFSILYLLPSLLTAAVLLLVLSILIILWPYGWLAVMARFLWGFVNTAMEQIRQAEGYAEKMPFTISLGIYFLIWLVFATLCLPLVLVGLVGHFFARRNSSLANLKDEPLHAPVGKPNCDNCGNSFPSHFYLEQASDVKYLCNQCRQGA